MSGRLLFRTNRVRCELCRNAKRDPSQSHLSDWLNLKPIIRKWKSSWAALYDQKKGKPYCSQPSQIWLLKPFTMCRKMVNVNVQIPFNLHNQNLGQRFDPSSSRSLRSNSGDIHASYSNQNSRRPSLSPVSSLHASHSTASLSHPEDLSLYTEPRKPILNVRLVRCIGSRRASSSRVRGRLGRFGEENGRDLYLGDGNDPSRTNGSAQDFDDQRLDGVEDLKAPRLFGQWPLHSTTTVSTDATFL